MWFLENLPLINLEYQLKCKFQEQTGLQIYISFLRLPSNNIPQANWLKQQRLMVSQFQRLEVQVQGVVRVMLPLQVPASGTSWLVAALPHSSLAFSLCVCVQISPFLTRTPVMLDQRSTLFQYDLILILLHQQRPSFQIR